MVKDMSLRASTILVLPVKQRAYGRLEAASLRDTLKVLLR
jgi:hypothetical protein